MKGPAMNFKILATSFFIGLFAVASTTYADYSLWNSDPETLQINDDNLYNDPQKTLANLFNNYFADQLAELGYSGYATSQDLYNDRGVKEVVANWTASEGASIQASFKNAAFAHTLSLLDNQGNVVDSTYFAGYSFDEKLSEGHVFNFAAGEYNFSLDVDGYGWFDNMFYGEDPSMNSDSLIHMVAFDVTDLVRLMFDDASIESAYLFGWEDMLGKDGGDFDYQDLAYLMINVSPNAAAATPEPSTMLILGFGGLAGVALLRRKLRKNKEAKDE